MISNYCIHILIHSAVPQSRPVLISVFTHVVRTYVRLHFSKSTKTKQISSENTGEIVGLAEWIIDDTCLVILYLCTDNSIS